MQSVAVFVYGDIGRSPRMQNHAVELSKSYEVYLMGYLETSPRSNVTENANIKLVDLQLRSLQFVRTFSYYLYVLIRIIAQILQIFYVLGWKYRGIKFVLVQNPPSIPNLLAIWLVSLVSRFKFCIDFHNYGYTILGLNVSNKFVVKAATVYEKVIAKRASKFFCVSEEMKKDLEANWGINAITLYDRPRQKEKLTFNKSKFLRKYQQRQLKYNEILVVSSTSWTKDEDFGILLNALEMYEKSEGSKFLRTLITGKGPQKQRYLKLIQDKKQSWKKISVDALWLDADDYPVLLSICDIGVCLHYSSSGLDLPMKVVDMFGAGIPVLAIAFPALPELVKDNKNGLIFKDEFQLYEQLLLISKDAKLLGQLKKNVEKQMSHTWQKQWEIKVKPILVD